MNNLESKDADVPCAGIEAAGNELDRHKNKLGLQERVIETQKRELGPEVGPARRRDTTTKRNCCGRKGYIVLGAGHVNTYESMPILARCYDWAGQDEQATQFGKDTFAVRRRVHVMYDLDWSRAQSQYKQASRLGEDTVEESMYSTQSIQILIDPLEDLVSDELELVERNSFKQG